MRGYQPHSRYRKGVTYNFVQKDISNFFHPFGLGYYPDGFDDELEPGIVPPGSNSECGDTNNCPAPMYVLDGEYLGEYSNDNEEIAPVTNDSEDFGLSSYRSLFFEKSPSSWVRSGTFEVALKFDVDDFTDDIFYYCKIHNFMSGRIKFVDSLGDALNEIDFPTIDYTYDEPSAYDQSCGTYNLNDFQLPHPECPEKFVCNKPEGVVGKFGECLDSMNCAMAVGMTTNVNQGSAIALFNHQMIPHHQNAVNMCKALFKSGEIECDDITQARVNIKCGMASLCYSIINEQNFQIRLMRSYLRFSGYDEEDDCKVSISKSPKESKVPKSSNDSKSPKMRKTL